MEFTLLQLYTNLDAFKVQYRATNRPIEACRWLCSVLPAAVRDCINSITGPTNKPLTPVSLPQATLPAVYPAWIDPVPLHPFIESFFECSPKRLSGRIDHCEESSQSLKGLQIA